MEIFQNIKNRKFKQIVTPDKEFGFWMGLAVGDMDNDGDQDLLFTNVGTSIPTFLLQGDLVDGQSVTPDWMLFRNDGEFKFTDVTKEYNLDKNAFAWGAVFEDLNLDGSLDLLVAQNYIKSVGMLTDQTSELTFGIGDLDSVQRVVIEKLDGTKKIIKNPSINKKILISNSSKKRKRARI